MAVSKKNLSQSDKDAITLEMEGVIAECQQYIPEGLEGMSLGKVKKILIYLLMERGYDKKKP